MSLIENDFVLLTISIFIDLDQHVYFVTSFLDMLKEQFDTLGNTHVSSLLYS